MRTLFLLACVLVLVYAEGNITGLYFRSRLDECGNEPSEFLEYSKDFNNMLCAGKKAKAIDKNNVVNRTRTKAICHSAIANNTDNQAKCLRNTEICFTAAAAIANFSIPEFVTFIYCVLGCQTLNLLDPQE